MNLLPPTPKPSASLATDAGREADGHAWPVSGRAGDGAFAPVRCASLTRQPALRTDCGTFGLARTRPQAWRSAAGGKRVNLQPVERLRPLIAGAESLVQRAFALDDSSGGCQRTIQRQLLRPQQLQEIRHQRQTAVRRPHFNPLIDANATQPPGKPKHAMVVGHWTAITRGHPTCSETRHAETHQALLAMRAR